MKYLRIAGIVVMLFFSGLTFAQDINWPDQNEASVQSDELEGKIYPNPTNGVFTVEIINPKIPLTVRIIDILGQIVKEDIFNEWSDLKVNKTYDLSYLNKGIYFVEISAGKSKVVKKLTIKYMQ